MNPWMRWRVFADKYNTYLLCSVMGAMTCAQIYLQYKNWKGERVTRGYILEIALQGYIFNNYQATCNSAIKCDIVVVRNLLGS